VGPTSLPMRDLRSSIPFTVTWATGRQGYRPCPLTAPRNDGRRAEARLPRNCLRLADYHLPVVGQPPLPVGEQVREITPVPVALAIVKVCGEEPPAFDVATTV
jgi:hypothetical protein